MSNYFNNVREVIDPRDGEVFCVITDDKGVEIRVDKHVLLEFERVFPCTRIFSHFVNRGSCYAMFHAGGGRMEYLHRWTMWMFGPPYDPERPTVDHINRDTFNNRLKNLRWANQSEQNYNQNKRVRVDRDIPLLWEGFTCQDVVCGVYYHFPDGAQAGYFAIDYKGLKKNMCKDRDVPVIQKYAETLQYLIDSGVEDRQDRVEELHRQLSEVRNMMGDRVAPRKAKHCQRSVTYLSDASGKAFAILRWTLGDECLNSAVVDADIVDQVLEARPDKDLMARIPASGGEKPIRMSLAKFIFSTVLGNSVALDEGGVGHVFTKNGIQGDLRASNLFVGPTGSNRRIYPRDAENFKAFVSGDPGVYLEGPVFAGSSAVPTGPTPPRSSNPPVSDFHFEKVVAQSGQAYTLACNKEDLDAIRGLLFAPDKNNLKVVLRKKSLEMHNSISGNADFRATLLKIEEVVRRNVQTVTLPAFVYYFICKNPVDNFATHHINTFTNKMGDVRRDNLWESEFKDYADPYIVANAFKELGYKFLPFRVRAIDSKHQITFKHFALNSTKPLPKPKETLLEYVERAPKRIKELDTTNQYDSLSERFNRMCSTHPDHA